MADAAATTMPATVLGYTTSEGEAIAVPEVVTMPATQVVYYSMPAAYSMPTAYTLPSFTPETPLTQPCAFKFIIEDNKEEAEEKPKVATKTKRACC